MQGKNVEKLNNKIHVLVNSNTKNCYWWIPNFWPSKFNAIKYIIFNSILNIKYILL